MKKLWAGAAILAALVVWFVTSGSNAPPEPVDVTGPDEVPEKALPAAVALDVDRTSGPGVASPTKPDPFVAAPSRVVAATRKPGDSLVARAWSETESRRRFAALDGAAKPEPKKKFPLDAKGIQAAVRAKKPQLRECYEPW